VLRSFTDQGFRVDVDLASQRLAIEVPDDQRTSWEDAELAPTLPTFGEWSICPAAALAVKAKQFDDGLYAAVELAVQRGGPRIAKTPWLLALARRDPASTLLWGAARLGGFAEPPASLDVDGALREFLSSELRSKPIGFYTWSEPLRRIFQQDRWLQRDLGPGEIAALVDGFAREPDARRAYETYLAFVERLTNGFAGQSVLDVLRGAQPSPLRPPKLVPASRAHETDLVKRLYSGAPIPDGFNLADELIARIRSGEVSLSPTAASGWYDYQTWALEPLVIPERMPEGQRIAYGDYYRALLRELFKALLALGRETHIKQLEIPPCGARMPREIIIAPKITLEPLPEYYLRRAWSYRFIWTLLWQTFGDELRTMHRLTASGPVATSLGEELADIESLFFGAYLTSCDELGMAPDPSLVITAEQARAVRARFARFDLASDPEVSADNRMMVPIYYDLERRTTKAWVFLGWASQLVEISFADRLRLGVTPERGGRTETLDVDLGGIRAAGDRPPILLRSMKAPLYYPMIVEVETTKIYDRDEFRRRCDQLRSRRAILDWLDGKQVTPKPRPPKDPFQKSLLDYAQPYYVRMQDYFDFPVADFTLRFHPPFVHEGTPCHYAWICPRGIARTTPVDAATPYLTIPVEPFLRGEPFTFEHAGNRYAMQLIPHELGPEYGGDALQVTPLDRE
jgi:hypothetical protein